MTDFEKLMQNSETMRMLKIGNPERSKDFGIPELQSGLFELERQTRENLENLIYTSPDPNGSIIKHDTALMLNNLGLDMETSRKLAEGGFASTATGIDTRSKSYNDALITKAQHAYWNEMRGVNASLYRVTGNPEFLKNAQEYDKKVFQNPVFESYGGLGDLVLDSVQPAISSAKFLLTNAILSWIPGGVANKVWGPAIAKLISKGGGIAATGINFLSTGYSQAGNVLYDVMQMTDGEGNTLPWDSPVGGILFHGLAGLMGLVELGSMEAFPWYKQLKSRFTSREVADYLKKGIAKSLLDVTFKGVVGTAAESIEEGLQSGLEDGFSNALKALANKDGADFDPISLGDSVKKGAKAFWDAGRSMFLTSFLSAGIGQGVYASKVRIEAAKNFKKSDSSQSVDSSFLGVPRSAVAEAKAEEAKKGEQAKSASADTEETKLDPIKVVNVGPRLSPVNDEELRKAAKAVNLGAKAMEVEVVEMPEIQAEDKFSLINRAALASGAKIIDGEELGFEDEQSMIKGMYLIAPSVEAVDDSSVGKVVTIRNENGELSKISMRVIPEDMSEEHVADPDIMFAEDPKAPYALSMMSEERALEWEERNLIRNALGDVTTHTKGRFSSADVEASIDAVKTVAETLNMPTDKLLSDGVVFHLTDKVQDEWGNEALGSITSNITVDGKKQYTINLSRKANVSTVLHELGHLLRGFATKEQLAEFRKYYGEGEEAAFLEDINLTNGKYHVGNRIFDTIEDARDYVIGNEERFADDFVAYMLTGEAPTAGLKNIFRRMKAVLHRFIAQYGNRLTPEVKEAFDNLLSGRESESVLAELSPQEIDGTTLFQKDLSRAEYAEVYDRYYNTDQWMKAPNGEWSNLNEQQWVTVRTPSFLNWFGNWIDDPKSVELALDENGEPEVFYHGSYTDDIEIFKIQPRLGYYFSDKNRGGFSFTNNREMAESYAVPQQKRVKAISNYLRELERALEDEGIVDLDSLEDPDNASPRLKRFYELLEEDEATAGETFEGHLPTFEYVYWDGDEFPFRQGREMWSKHVPRAIEKEFPELAKRLRKAGRDLRVGKGVTTPKVYEVFLRIPEGTNTKSLTPKTLYEIGDFFDVSKEKTGAFVVLMPEGEKVAYIADSKMIKSATDNAGTFDGENPNILYQKTMDDRYFEALDRGDEETARKIVDDMARKRGYLSGNDFRMNHKAPNGRNDYDVNLPNLDGSELLPKDFWDHPRWYAGDHELYSFWKVKEAIDRYRRNGKANIRLYRAVPKDVREDWFRNGDWVTPDRTYAQGEGALIPGGYRIIVHSVPIEHVWWDVNSIAELGYDDGGEYVYRNTKNNRKLFDTVVRDADGKIVPPSKRFNFRSDTLYQKAPKEGTKEFEQTFAFTKIVDENGNPRMVYHGSMREWQGAGTEFDPYKIGSQSDPGDAGEGFYFATTPLGAYMYTNGKQDNVHGYYLDIRNPFVIGEQYDRESRQAWEAVMQGKDPGVLPTVQMIADMVRGAGYDPGELTKFRDYISAYDVVKRVGSGNFSRLLKANGYDGVVYGDEIVAFDPGQIYYASKPATLYQIEAYHGTSKDFDKFSTDFIGSGFSGGSYGWGLYFTTDEDVARNYAEIIGNRNLEKRVLYRINLGRIGKHTLLPWSEPINERVRSMLREPMLKLEYPQSLHRRYGTSTTEGLVSVALGENATGNSLYFFLEKAFDDWSGEKASLFLREHGITGTVKSDLMGNYTYAIFDENAVEIVGKTLYKMAPPSGTEDFKKWYGSSVLVDGKGNPIEVLHGSQSMFNDFARTQENDNGYLGAGHYFTGIRGIALTYATKNNDGYIYHAYLKMENPLRYDQEWDKKWTEIRNEVVAENPEVPENSNLFGKLLVEKLQDNGYDGVLDMRNGTVAEAVVFSNDQIGIVAVESYNLGEAGSEYNRRKIGEMRQRQIAKNAVQQAIPDLALAQGNLVPPTLYQVQNLPKWKEDTRAWMKANGYTGAQIDRHIAGIEGQLKIFDFVGPYEIDLLPHGAGLNPWKRVSQKGDATYQGGPIRTNDDPIYRISFDLSAMCPKRLSAAATANYVQKKIGRPLSDSERMALTALYRAHGKEAPCIYCYVESPRSKASSFVLKALEVVLGGEAPKTWSSETLSLAEEARAEAVAKNVQRGDLNAHMLMDPELASSDEFKAEVDKYPAIYKFLKKQMLNAKANLPKLYEEYEGQILNLPDDFIDMLNGYAGIRFFSSSDFQAQHVVDLIQAVYDMNVRGAKAHAYTKVPKFVEVFGGTGIKINTSIFAKEENGQIVEDNWQGMGWEDAKRFRQQYDNVGTILVASSDNIVKWALEQDWIDYIIPFHYSSLEKKYYSTMEWEDFTSTQVEKPINVGEEVQKIRQFETGSVDGISNVEGTRRYLELAMQRGIIPVFPTFLFNDGMEDVVGKNGKPYKNQRKAKTDRAVARWREMIESGRIDWSQINHNYYKLRKDYARTDTPFHVVQPNINFEQASDVLKEYLSGAEDGVRGEREIGDELVRMIIDSEGTDIDLGVEVLRGVQEGRMSGKDPLFQRMSPPGSQEFMSWYKGSMLVDGDGAPLKLYHGTASIFTEYNPEYGTLNMGDSEGSEGFFFTTDKDEAISYAEFAVSPEVMAYRDEHRAVLRKMGELGVKRGSDHPLEERALELERKITEEEDLIGIGAQAWDPVVSGVYVRITNPAIIDLSDPDMTGEINFRQLIQEAKASGHDGFIYKNVNDSDAMHVVAFSDSQVGAVEYSLSSEGYEDVHAFPSVGSAVLESVIDYKGHSIIPHDLGMDYSEGTIDSIVRNIDDTLNKITLYQNKPRWEPGLFEPAEKKPRRIIGNSFLLGSGWDGGEAHPTIDGDWRKFRKIDFQGMVIRNPEDLAKLISIYRNPMIEYFHIVYITESVEGISEIKGHHAMTAGAPGFTFAMADRFPADVAEAMERYDATGYYIIHNHPSGDITASMHDKEVTRIYGKAAPGLLGHIILDHDKFLFIDSGLGETVYDVREGFHQVPERKALNEKAFSGVHELGMFVFEQLGSRGDAVVYTDMRGNVLQFEPSADLDLDHVYRTVYDNFYARAFYITNNRDRFMSAAKQQEAVSRERGRILSDVILYYEHSGQILMESADEYDYLGSSREAWSVLVSKKHGDKKTGEYVFESKTLYKLSDEAKKHVLEARKEDVRKAIENYYWIPDDVLQEYTGEKWADREIRFRTRLKENPWVLEEARGYTDPDEYLEFVVSRDIQDGKPSSDGAKKWWRRVYEYARIESTAERNLRFVREHTSSDKSLIALAKRLRGYIATDQKTGKRGYRLGSFKGVSPFVKTLSPNSSSEDIQKARTLVTENPEPYRKALQKIVQAERIVYNDGKFDLPSQEDREAYYDSLGEEMSDALKEPLLINQLSGGEDAEFLRTLVDHRGSYTEREKMATLNGVLEIENQADKELAALRSEYDRKANSLTELQKRFDIVTREVNKLGDELREVRKDRSNLKRNLKGTQEMAVNLREALAEKREAYRKLERERKALERKLHAVRTRRDLEKYHKAILASAKFNPNSIDASYEEALNTIYDLFRQDRKEGGYKMLPEVLTRYLDDEGLHAIKANKRIGDWSLIELGTLYYAIRAMKADARVMLERKKVDRSGKLQNLAIKYYRQLYGELPEIDPFVGGVMGSIMEELSIKQKKYQEGMFGAIWNTVAGAIIHSQRLARIIDGNREGVMYDLLVRRAYENSNKELSHSFERLEAAEAKMRALLVTDKSLRQDLYTYTTIAGDKITLTRGEVIGLYVYSQNKQGLEKLVMSWGNGISLDQLSEAVGKLTDNEKAWGDYMIDELGGDDPWERMRDVYYNVYNKNLGRRKRYFTFVADGNLNEGNTDLLNGPKGRPIRYTDKGMTEKVVPHARYALKLDVTRTFTQQVKRQEHFIAWAEWVRDMNYLLSSRGSIGAMIEANHGSKILTQVQDFVNDIGSPQVILDDIERLGNKILSNAVVGALSFNALTPLKQLASLSAVVRGDIDISSLFHAARRLGNPAIRDRVVKMIHEKSPKMKNRTFDVEVAKYNATEFDTELGMAIKAINEKVGMRAIQWMDQLVANLVWLSAYDTALKRGATDAEAAFRATEVVGETQSSTNISDLSSLQRKKNPWVRSMLMFTNDIIQHLNQIWFDLPYYVRSKQYRKSFGTMANVAIAGAISLLVSGQLFRGDDDDEEYLKKIAKAILGIIVSDTIPVVGNAVASGVSGWAGGDMVDLPSAFGRFLGAATDLEGEKLLDAFLNLIEAGLKFGALPVTAGNRVVRAVREQNPLHLLNYDYAELWEEWF